MRSRTMRLRSQLTRCSSDRSQLLNSHNYQLARPQGFLRHCNLQAQTPDTTDPAFPQSALSIEERREFMRYRNPKLVSHSDRPRLSREQYAALRKFVRNMKEETKAKYIKVVAEAAKSYGLDKIKDIIPSQSFRQIQQDVVRMIANDKERNPEQKKSLLEEMDNTLRKYGVDDKLDSVKLLAEVQEQREQHRKQLRVKAKELKQKKKEESKIPLISRVERSKEFKHRDKYQQKVSIVMTPELHEMIDETPELREPEMEQQLVKQIVSLRDYIKDIPNGELRAMFLNSAVEAAQTEQLQRMKDANLPPLTCRTACCHRMVMVTEDEGALLASHLRSQYPTGVPSELMVKLEAQAVYNEKNAFDFWKLPYQDSACVFLNDEDMCSIYNSRPTFCRKHQVTSNPHYCSKGAFEESGDKRDIIANIEVETLISAAMTANDKGPEPLPQAILKHLRLPNQGADAFLERQKVASEKLAQLKRPEKPIHDIFAHPLTRKIRAKARGTGQAFGSSGSQPSNGN